ncbi:MAG: hypothetical protein PHF63_12635, partial [Herbinix sp.]|nr:hypothetical protein [Herbinix sp.]
RSINPPIKQGVLRMNEELGQVDADLKGLFVDKNYDEMIDLLKEQPDTAVKEINDYNWNIIKKYYETEKFDLLLSHFTFVAYTCFIVEYTHQIGLISDNAFNIMMAVYNDIYELKKQ